MSYAHIDNLYKNQTILRFKQCWALEKVHGTSAHITYTREDLPHGAYRSGIKFFAGGAKHDAFVALFNLVDLEQRFTALGPNKITVYGEAYGGKLQGMAHTYGPDLRFIVFDVKVGDLWLDVPSMCEVAHKLDLEAVPCLLIPTTMEAIDQQRDAPSTVADWRGCGGDKIREGVVLRPPFEVRTNNGARIVAKHKRAEFSERKNPPKPVDFAKAQALRDAEAIAEEWVTPMRLEHVLDKLPVVVDMTSASTVIRAMLEDVYREAAGEVVESKEASSAIGRRTAALLKARLNGAIGSEP